MAQVEAADQKECVLKKHAAAVHIGASKMTLMQRKSFNALLWNAFNTMEQEDLFSIQVGEFCRMIDFDHSNVKFLKGTLLKMMRVVVEWNLLQDGVEEWNACSLIPRVKIKNGIIYYRFEQDLKPLLLNPEIYSLLRLEVVNVFKSKYSLHLYENCQRFVNVGRTGWIEVDIVRKMLGVEKTPLYSSFAELRRRILVPSMEEINLKSDIKVEMEAKKAGKTVTHISFTVSKSDGFKLPRAKPRQLSLPGLVDVEAQRAIEAQKAVKEGVFSSKVPAWAKKPIGVE